MSWRAEVVHMQTRDRVCPDESPPPQVIVQLSCRSFQRLRIRRGDIGCQKLLCKRTCIKAAAPKQNSKKDNLIENDLMLVKI